MDQDQIIKNKRHRTRPNIFDFSYILTKANLKIFLRFRDYLGRLEKPLKILDLGCGYKPFKSLLDDSGISEYVGIDSSVKFSSADIIGSIDNIPFPDDHFDGLIASQVFEHAAKLDESVKEIKRVAKNGALIYVSSPFVYQEHGAPTDYQRLTKYKYQELFKKDEIILLEATNCNLGTPFFVCNLCWASTPLRKLPLITTAYYLLNNLLIILSNALIAVLKAIGGKVYKNSSQKFVLRFENNFFTMPAGYNLIVRIKK